MGSRSEIETEVTERILSALREGTVPWSRPWSVDGTMPTSATTGKAYRGINVWLLTLETMRREYSSAYWLTFKQAKTLGGSVRKGERGTRVIFWRSLEITDNTSGEAKTIPMMRQYTVFNVDQCNDVTLPPRMRHEREPVPTLQAMDDVLTGYVDGPTVGYAAQGRAFYDPRADSVTLPLADTFESSESLAGVMFHELTHSTGHVSRLDRFAKNGEPQHFGSELYAREELVAEMGSQLIGANVGVSLSTERSASYVQSWLGALSDDHGLVITAAQQAQRSTDWVLGS